MTDNHPRAADAPKNEKPRRKRSAAQEIAADFIDDFDDLPDAAFFALAEEMDIDVEDLGDD